VDLPHETILLRVNEGVVTKKKTIFSTNQLRAYGCQVYDIPLKYGGKQAIVLSEGLTIPLKYKAGLHYMKIRKPTDDELIDYPVIDLTSGAPWDPRIFENDECCDEDGDSRLIAAKSTKPA
jgi:hypothetical protein